MFDWLILRIPGWSRKIRKLRKEWNKARERALTKKNPLKRLILKKLDDIENHLRMLEEQRMGRYEKKRFAREIEIVLAEVNILLKSDSESITSYTASERRTKKQAF